MPLFCLPNLSATQVAPIEPWTAELNHAPPAGLSKGDLSKWMSNPNTNGIFLSAFEGMNPHIRVSKANIPFKMHGLIADYDTTMSEKELHEGLIAHSKAGMRPAYAHRTYSGRGRVIWLFEKPLLLPEKLVEPFLKILRKELGANKLFGGLDDAILDATQYYHYMGPLLTFSPDRLSDTVLSFLLGRAFDATKKYRGEGDMEIPLDAVYAEVEAKFPGRWTGSFEAGARGVCFWNPLSDNPTAAIVTPTGMVAFSQDKPFFSWAELLGFTWVKQFEQDRFGKPLQAFYYDGRYYWSKDSSNIWRADAKEDSRHNIMSDYGMSGAPDARGSLSEVDQVLRKIRETRRVDKAYPVLYSAKDTVPMGGELVLNISRVKPVQPHEHPVEFGEGFPWLGEFFEHFFDPTLSVEGRAPSPAFYSWLHRLYKSAYENNLVQGQAIFIAGGVGRGKSLLGNIILGDLMGGFADASEYLLGESAWNGELLHKPVWVVDDAKSTTNYEKHAMWTEMIKKSVANTVHKYNVKFRDEATVKWCGRVVVSLNDDPESIRQIPHTDRSTLDKIMLLKTSDYKMNFLPNSAQEALIRSELPYFARWILDYEIPVELRGSNRFGVESYHHPVLLEDSKLMSRANAFRETTDIFLVEYKRVNQDRTYWEGTTMALLQEFAGTLDLKELVRHYMNTPEQMGRRLASLMAIDPGSVSKRRCNGQTLWKLRLPAKV